MRAELSATGTATNHQATSTAPVGGAANVTQWLRVTASGVTTTTCTFTFSTSADNATWTPVGSSIVSTAAAGLFAADYPWEIGVYEAGTDPLAGKVFAAQLRSGVDGTVVGSPNFAAQTAGTTSFSDAQGNAWSLSGAASIAGTPELESSLLLRRRRCA